MNLHEKINREGIERTCLRRSLLIVIRLLTVLLITQATARLSPAQQVNPRIAADPAQEILKISTEEVRIPVFAFDERGRFDPTLSVDDLLVREDGVAQRVTGVYRVPAHVLLLADTGGDLNPVKNVRLTAGVAFELISHLRPDDSVAIMQVNGAVELVKGWSRDRAELIEAIRTKLLPGKRSRLAEGLVRATEYLQQAPLGNRHVVIISDGYDSSRKREELNDVISSLGDPGIAVHVISYTSLTTKKPPITRASAKSNLPEELILSLPVMRSPETYVPDPKDVLRARGAWAIDIDRLFRGSGDLKEQMARSELDFAKIAEETGGVAWLPTTAEEMLMKAAEAARDIDSQYVVTYRPHRSLSEAKLGEYRKLDVISRRVGLSVRSKRGYIANLLR